MNIDPDTIPAQTPREQASQLINDYARKAAALEACTASIRAEITALTAALNKAAAPHVHELERIEAEAKQLALEHGEAIFGEKRTLQENGFVLGIREATAVQVENEEAAIRMLQKDAANTLPGSDTAMACNACLRINITLDREYITRHYDEAPEWFDCYGINLVDKVSASLKPAPKPRAKKATKLKTAETPVEQEAA